MTNLAFIVICCLLAPCCLARVFDGAVQPLSSCGNGHGTVEVTLLGEEGCSNAVLLAMENRTPYPYGFGQQSLSSGFDCLELDFITSSGRMFTLKRRMPPGLCDLPEWNEVEPGYQWTMPVKLDDEAWIIPEGAVEHSPAFVRPRFAFGGFRVGDKFYRLKEDADRKVMRHYGWSDRQGELVGEWIPLSRLNLQWTTITRREATSPDSCGEDGVWTDPSGNTWRYHAVSGGVEIGRAHIGAKDGALCEFLAMSGSKDDLYKGAFSVGVTPNPTNDVLCLPDKILGRAVVSVGDYAFLGLAGPKRVTVPSAIRRIGTGAFARSEVAVVEFASGVLSVGKEAFLGCRNLERVNLPEGPRDMMWLWDECPRLEELTVPEGVVRLSDRFSGCRSLTRISLPSTLDDLSEASFSSCEALARIDVQDSCERYFSDKGVLYARDPISVLHVPRRWSGRLKVLDGVAVMPRITSEDLVAVEIPASVKNVERAAFVACRRLEEITVDPANGSFGVDRGMLFRRDTKTVLAVPSALPVSELRLNDPEMEIASEACVRNMTLRRIVLAPNQAEIGAHTFFACTNLSAVVFPRKLIGISKFAFCECGLEQVSFPATLRRLDPGCFRGNSNLTTVTFRAEVSITFGGEVVWTSCRDGDDGNTCRVDSRAFEDCPQLDSVVIAGRTYSWRKIEASVKDATNARNRKIE